MRGLFGSDGPIFRLKIKTLMVAVAGVALAIGSARTATELYHRYKAIRQQRLTTGRQHGLIRQVEERCFLPTDYPEMTRKQAAIVRFHKDLEQKYLEGANEPWVDLPPDPPEPPPVIDLEEMQREITSNREQTRRIMERLDDQWIRARP